MALKDMKNSPPNGTGEFQYFSHGRQSASEDFINFPVKCFYNLLPRIKASGSKRLLKIAQVAASGCEWSLFLKLKYASPACSTGIVVWGDFLFRRYSSSSGNVSSEFVFGCNSSSGGNWSSWNASLQFVFVCGWKSDTRTPAIYSCIIIYLFNVFTYVQFMYMFCTGVDLYLKHTYMSSRWCLHTSACPSLHNSNCPNQPNQYHSLVSCPVCSPTPCA